VNFVRYYPIFIDLENRKVVFSGAGEHAAAKIRLLLKTSADIQVFGENPCESVSQWAAGGRLKLWHREPTATDMAGARLVYGANDEPAMDRRAVELGKKAGALANLVDNLEESEFLTPAMVDRDPVTIAIGTEGTAPVLARKIKADIEEMLPASTGLLARVAEAFRPIAATLVSSAKRRTFWNRYFFEQGPKAIEEGGETALEQRLHQLFDEISLEQAQPGSVALVGAGPGDPELLTLKARRVLNDADVVLYDNLVSAEILELARREALLVNVGKKGFGKGWKQQDINALMIEHAGKGARIVRLKSGDPTIFGRLDEEIEALDNAGIDWHVVPGITAASAASAGIGASLTRRGRNSALQFVTGHDVAGFAEHDWRQLARKDATAAIYMGVKAAAFIRGRLLMHGALPDTPVTVVANASRANQRVVATTLLKLPDVVKTGEITGPAILLLGLAPKRAAAAVGFVSNQTARTGTN
jgi:uroporphyrin-III C-methyltransferase/precorrin-2 dehydrogenase/sirohydrochlorin ferrochelatase